MLWIKIALKCAPQDTDGRRPAIVASPKGRGRPKKAANLSAPNASGFALATGEQFFTIGPQFAFLSDEPVKRLPGNLEFGTQIAHLGFGLPHRRMSKAQLGRGHLKGTTAVPPSRAG